MAGKLKKIKFNDETVIEVPIALSELESDSEHRTVTDAEKDKWNKGAAMIIDTAENLERDNPVLDVGQFGYDTTNKIIKIGDGVTPWNDLPNAIEYPRVVIL